MQGFKTMDVAALLATPFPPREQLLAPWLPAKGLAMVYGPRGIGKTHLTLGIAYAVASGGSFLGWQAPQPRRVLVVDGEMPAVALQERMAAIVATATKHPPHPGLLRLLPMDWQEHGGLDLSDPACHPLLEQAAEGADLLLMDNVSTLMGGGRENEAESWLPVQQWALGQRRRGRSVVFIHHAGKGGQQRGTSRREDVLDTVVALRRPSDWTPDTGARFEVHFEKARGFGGPGAKPVLAALADGAWTVRDLGDEEGARVLQMHADGMSVREIADATGSNRSAIARMLTRAREVAAAPPQAA